MQPFLLHTDGDPKNQPDKSSRLNINVNITREYGTISTEDGNEPLTQYPHPDTYTAIAIGKVPLRDGNTVIFSAVPGNSTLGGQNGRYVSGEIGVLSEDGSYRVVLRDNGPVPASGVVTSFGWDLNTQVQGTYKVGLNDEIIVYFTDFKNPLRHINITNLDIATDDSQRITSLAEMDKLYVLSPFTNQTIFLDSVTNEGSLKTGVYYVFLVPTDADYNETNGLFPSNPISIINEISTVPIKQYDGAVANSSSPKAFKVSILSPDDAFSYYRVYVIAKINQVITVYDHGYQPIIDGTFDYVVSNNEDKATSSLDVIVNKVNWISKTISQNDNKLYVANLKENTRPNLQPWFNGIVVDIATSEKDPLAFDDSFFNEKNIYSARCFQYDEVYALYGSVVWADGSESEAYHIPGRDAVNIDLPKDDSGSAPNPGISTVQVLENVDRTGFALIADDGIYNGGGTTDTSPGGEMQNVDINWRTFHAFDTSYNTNVTNVKGLGVASNLGFWQNENELYPNTTDWIIKDSTGAVVGEDLRGKKVRHHKTPGAEHMQNDYDLFNQLAFVFKNIQFPAELEGEIVGVNFYYAKRTNENRLVLGQSILTQDAICTKSDGNDIVVSGVNLSDYSFSVGSTVTLSDFLCGGNPGADRRNMSLVDNRFRMAPFDIVSANIDCTSVSHIKIFKVLKGDFTDYGTVKYSDPAGNLNYFARYLFEPKLASNMQLKASTIRRVGGPCQLAESIPQYPYTSNSAENAGQLGYVKNTVHYRNDVHVIVETYNDIDTAICYPDGVFNLNANGGGGGTANTGSVLDKNLIVGNLCQHKQNLYLGFDNQELVFTGVVNPATHNMFGAGDYTTVLGGDTFVSWYGYRGCGDIVAALNFDSNNSNVAGEWRMLHYYVCESNANINYRNQGTGIYDIYYPKSTFHDVVDVPLLPNGQGNYMAYNKDYSSVNDLRSPKIHQKNYIRELTHFPTRIARSQNDSLESTIDNYRVFLANEYTDIDKSKGSITNIHFMSNRMVIECENGLKISTTRDRIKTDLGEAFLGAGDIFDYPPKDVITTDSGYAGLKYQFASVLTQYGIFFPDVNTSKIFCLSEELKVISDQGLSLYCLDNLKLNFGDYYRDLVFSLVPTWVVGTYDKGQVVKYNNSVWKVVADPDTTDVPTLTNTDWELLYTFDTFTFVGKDSIFYGYIAGFDNYYRRFMITKKDIVVTDEFTNNFVGQYDAVEAANWTEDSTLLIYEGQLYMLVSAPGTDTIVTPEEFVLNPIYFNNTTYFIQDRFSLAYYPEHKGWASWYQYYPDNYISNRNKFFTTKDNVAFEQDVIENILIPDNTGPVDTVIEPIFNQSEPVRLLSIQWKTKALDNSNNEEVLTTFDSVQAYDSYQLSKQSTISNTNNSRNLEGYWSCNDFRDFTNDNDLKVVDNSLWYRPFTNNLNLTKHWSKLKKLVDFWFGARFKYVPYTETTLTQNGTSGFSPFYDYETFIQIELYTVQTINVGDILKITTTTGVVFYCKVITNPSANIFKVKMYGPKELAGMGDTISSIVRLTKKPKLHLLDVAKLVIKNIR